MISTLKYHRFVIFFENHLTKKKTNRNILYLIKKTQGLPFLFFSWKKNNFNFFVNLYHSQKIFRKFKKGNKNSQRTQKKKMKINYFYR